MSVEWRNIYVIYMPKDQGKGGPERCDLTGITVAEFGKIINSPHPVRVLPTPTTKSAQFLTPSKLRAASTSRSKNPAVAQAPKPNAEEIK
jgi:hypothetical protein